ncbi:hypothetical protein [Deinococcus sp. Leaf326]|uniref:hypothetical protein n=1 Tax=Deinococcus sp. Leaf326 TaxID=1736338 RepID=UPI0006F85E7A|nr:hypothetical protein [Deinococcus sp. Leaf326]KQR15452.1 hypothetical protein ASF71_20505 [Deinococcus sp. Leaf326]
MNPPNPMHPDERALKLTRALQDHDLDTLLPLLEDVLRWPRKQLYSNLRPIFAAAQQDGVNLLRPPDDFQAWLQVPLRQTVRGPGTAKSNTIAARLSTLSRLYNTLMDEGLILRHPLRGLERPPPLLTPDPLPTQEDVVRLLRHAEDDPALHAALTLIYHHAVQVPELLALRWPAFLHEDGTLLRRRTVTRLDEASSRALDRLLTSAGGPLSDPQGRIFPYTHNDDLRARIFQVSRAAGVPFFNPAQLRKAALRDFVFTPDQAGSLGEQTLELVRALAEGLAPDPKP